MAVVHLSLIIPAYNEKNRIGNTLHQAKAYLSKQSYTWEILVVDDGSHDGTADFVQTTFPDVRVVRYTPNRGKGHAVKTGMLVATGTYRLFSDADGSTPISELEKLWIKFDEGADIVIGSRSLPESDVQVRQHPIREAMGRIFNLFVKTVLGERYIDTQCGFKGFRAATIPILFERQTIERFCFEAELLYIARKFGLRVAEVPVRWRNSPDSRVRIFIDSFDMFCGLLKIRWNDGRGKYR